MFTKKLYLVSYDLKTNSLLRDTQKVATKPYQNQYTLHWQEVNNILDYTVTKVPVTF